MIQFYYNRKELGVKSVPKVSIWYCNNTWIKYATVNKNDTTTIERLIKEIKDIKGAYVQIESCHMTQGAQLGAL